MKKIAPDYKNIAETFLFSEVKVAEIDLFMTKHKVVFRKGKNVEDINKAIQKAGKKGHGRTEFEISMLECYLMEVFKSA